MGTFHPLQPAYIADPFPYLARLRATDPVYYSTDMQGYVLTRYTDCVSVLRDDEHFSSDPTNDRGGLGDSVRCARAASALGSAPVLANCDGAVHVRLREALAASFRARDLLSQGAAAGALARTAVDSIQPGVPTDVMALVASSLPLTMLLDYLGVPNEHRPEFRECIVRIMRARMDGDRDASAARASYGAASDLARLVMEETDPSSSGVLPTLIGRVGSGEIGMEEMLMLLVHVATAGNAATAFAIGNAVLALARNPDAWDELRADRSLLRAAVDECMRYESPTHITSRFALANAEVGGKRIPPGRTVHLAIAGANRDPEAFPEPDHLDLRRQGRPHLGFGFGAHYCLGAPLGTAEVEAVLTALLDRFARLEVAPGGYEAASTIFLRGPRRLVVKAA